MTRIGELGAGLLRAGGSSAILSDLMSWIESLGQRVVVFCDGACSGNPGPGGWGSIVVTPGGEVRELGGGDPRTTNNQMELSAVIETLRDLSSLGSSEPISIFTDSVYVIRGITQWIWGWRRRGWLTAEGKEVANRDYWQELSRLVDKRKIEWHFVRGHVGIPGNERCDEIAVAYSKGQSIRLYRGSLLQYGIAIFDIPENTDVPEMKSPQGPKAKAHSYLSLLGGTVMRHATWAECERRVKGQPGAKFKKAMSPDEEISIVKGWGMNPKDVKDP